MSFRTLYNNIPLCGYSKTTGCYSTWLAGICLQRIVLLISVCNGFSGKFGCNNHSRKARHLSAMRNNGQPLRCASIRQVTFVSTKRSFVATKVQLAWKTLYGRTMPSGNDYYTQIYRRSRCKPKSTTQFFGGIFLLTMCCSIRLSWNIHIAEYCCIES